MAFRDIQKITRHSFSSLSLLLPIVLFAPTSIAFAKVENFKGLVLKFVEVLDVATITISGLALLFFLGKLTFGLWGYNGENVEQRKKMQQTIVWGLITLFVLFSIWGIIQALQRTITGGLIN